MIGITGIRIFPTPVGVFPLSVDFQPPTHCLPHARGGVSNFKYICAGLRGSSPRPWGCFSSPASSTTNTGVFPTPVGVFLTEPIGWEFCSGLPHTHKNISSASISIRCQIESSPHPWGCFLLKIYKTPEGLVFPTPVGVFLNDILLAIDAASLPHARGGVSDGDLMGALTYKSSPRPWGCF